jgi:hypothetical protein
LAFAFEVYLLGIFIEIKLLLRNLWIGGAA